MPGERTRQRRPAAEHVQQRKPDRRENEPAAESPFFWFDGWSPLLRTHSPRPIRSAIGGLRSCKERRSIAFSARLGNLSLPNRLDPRITHSAHAHRAAGGFIAVQAEIGIADRLSSDRTASSDLRRSRVSAASSLRWASRCRCMATRLRDSLILPIPQSRSHSSSGSGVLDESCGCSTGVQRSERRFATRIRFRTRIAIATTANRTPTTLGQVQKLQSVLAMLRELSLTMSIATITRPKAIARIGGITISANTIRAAGFMRRSVPPS